MGVMLHRASSFADLPLSLSLLFSLSLSVLSVCVCLSPTLPELRRASCRLLLVIAALQFSWSCTAGVTHLPVGRHVRLGHADNVHHGSEVNGKLAQDAGNERLDAVSRYKRKKENSHRVRKRENIPGLLWPLAGLRLQFEVDVIFSRSINRLHGTSLYNRLTHR